MRAATILVLTFAVWTAAKGTTKAYWLLATTSAASGSGAGAATGGEANHAAPPPNADTYMQTWDNVNNFGLLPKLWEKLWPSSNGPQ